LLGQKIKIALKEKGVKQIELAERLGIAKQHMNKLLKSNDIKFSVLVQISEFLNLDIDYFVEKTESKTNVLQDPPVKYYKKPKFIEQRLDELEKKCLELEKKIKKSS
jgi:transcriptional regulator with XRE-family HTH domain